MFWMKNVNNEFVTGNMMYSLNAIPRHTLWWTGYSIHFYM
jgi:hypothetical protein